MVDGQVEEWESILVGVGWEVLINVFLPFHTFSAKGTPAFASTGCSFVHIIHQEKRLVVYTPMGGPLSLGKGVFYPCAR